jgi:hypothetical protein
MRLPVKLMSSSLNRWTHQRTI